MMEDIPVVILAGGLGTRLREQTEFIPKPMVPVGGKPILWHIMKIYSHYGFKRFVVCLGYKGDIIKEYFFHYNIMNSDFTVKLGDHRSLKLHNSHSEEDWEVTLADTGLKAMTGARVKRIEKNIDADLFMVTYGDGVADIDIARLVEFHRSHGKVATITGVRPPSRFGELILKDGSVVEFSEKPQVAAGLINGGFLVLDRRVFEYLSDDDSCVLEREPLERLSKDGELMAFHHKGFWQCMDTLRDVDLLNQYWKDGNPPWKVWRTG